MATTYEVPLSPEPQTFSISLAGTTYKLRLCWCTFTDSWIIDIADANSVPLLQGIPLVTGADLLEQHQHLGIGGTLTAQTDHNPDAVPTFENLGIHGRLYFTAS